MANNIPSDLERKVEDFLFNVVSSGVTLAEFKSIREQVAKVVRQTYHEPEQERDKLGLDAVDLLHCPICHRARCVCGHGKYLEVVPKHTLMESNERLRELLSRVVHKYEGEWGEIIEEIRAEIE